MPVRSLIISIFLLILLSSCSQKTKRSMYYWKTRFDFKKQDTEFLKSNSISTLYVRFFDLSVSQQGTAFPKAPLICDTLFPADIQLVPVVFIENESLINISPDSIISVAQNVILKIETLAKSELKVSDYSEIQLDCDWNKASKDLFFSLVSEIKKKSGKEISVTVRLHQLKHQTQTGIPPADRGVLMYYNMGQLKNPTEINSILNNTIGKKYLQNAPQYPYELSLALPVFSWSVLFRNNEFVGILNQINEKNIDSVKFLQKQKKNSYLVQSDTVFGSYLFRYGDILRLENITISELERSKTFCHKFTNHEIILFSYSPETNILHNENNFNRIYNIDY